MKDISINNADLIPRLQSQWQLKQQAGKTTLDNQKSKKRFELNSISAMIIERCDGERHVDQLIESLCAQFPDARQEIPTDVEKVLRELHQANVLEFSPHKEQQIFPVPAPSPRHKKHKLCIGMATYDDYDGVYFSIQAIRLYHPEILRDSEIIVIDNHPDGPCSEALKNLENWVSAYRYVPCEHIKGTSVRNYIFHEANADYVLCIDSHVLIQPGAIKQLLDYFEAQPDTNDFLQGPLQNDNMTSLSTHFKPKWSSGMYGTWGYDERGAELNNEPFDIPMQGLGLFACRKAAWLGFNPRFSGFGGEEGYIHEKFRQAGARTLCLPFLRWVHRFVRPMGTQYTVRWEDRIRNYLIGHHELGLDTQALIEHFTEHVGEELTLETIQTVEVEISNPFYYFDAIYCLMDEQQPEQWVTMQGILEKYNITQRVKPYAIDANPDINALSKLSAHRDIFQQAKDNGLQNILIFDAGAQATRAINDSLTKVVNELATSDWAVFYLALSGKTQPYRGAELLAEVVTHHSNSGIAYRRSAFTSLLESLPTDEADTKTWLADAHTLEGLIEQTIDQRVALKA